MGLLEKLIGTYSEREVKKVRPLMEKVLAKEDEMRALSDAELKAKTPELKERYQKGESLDDLLPEAFAVMREAADRVLGMRHFPVQVIGGIILHQGRIAEMKTGEGKTLVATLPAYLNALSGRGVHIVTVNDYLARRDSEWMGKVYRFLGLTVGLVVPGMEPAEKKAAYEADITYATNNELGFDYLRDNMVIYKDQMVQRGHVYAIVDEVDSILIDEARTPLIISGAGDESTEMYNIVDRFVRGLTCKKIVEMDAKTHDDADYDADYIVDEKAKTATLTEQGVKKAEAVFHVDNLSDPNNMQLSHHINQAIKAHGTMMRDREYVVKDGEVLIVDEFTGRIMLGRRYSDGLHQAIEAKEGVSVMRENKTLATITFQNFFRMYEKLAGMTGTALTEETEFEEIYNLDVIEIPTNRPVARIDNPDAIYRTEKEKFNAVADLIAECHQKGQPVLAGTVTIDKSEELSALLKRRGIKHEVLNAKYHEKEAQIIAQAGKLGAVTIATNMAGRGTDIMLGGNAEYMAKNQMEKLGYADELIAESTGFADTDDEEILGARAKFKELYDRYKDEIATEHDRVVELGGLYIIGTERHESRRIDNQLRGRGGRQGDPGESRFFISLEDDLMRLFGSERLDKVVSVLGLQEGEAIEHSMVSRAIENAQEKIEGRNFNIRKHVLEYDNVMNTQRETIYGQRRQVLDDKDLKASILKMMDQLAEEVTGLYCNASAPDDWNWEGLRNHLSGQLGIQDGFRYTRDEMEDLDRADLTEAIQTAMHEKYAAKEAELGEERMREVERIIMLRAVDNHWMDHIDQMDQLRREIGTRAYGQHDPVQEYKIVGFDMFEEMIAGIREDTVRLCMNVVVNTPMERKQVAQPLTASHGDGSDAKPKTVVKKKTVGRNDPCPCGSGKKYKFCCGKDAE